MSFLENIQPEKLDMKEVYEETDVEKQFELESKKILQRGQRSQMQDMRDTQYYCVLVFGNKNDRNKFIVQLKDSVYIEGETFIDGYEFAKSIGIEIQCSAKMPEPYHIKKIKVKKNGNIIGRKSKDCSQ
jgi:hypothetical protein